MAGIAFTSIWNALVGVQICFANIEGVYLHQNFSIMSHDHHDAHGHQEAEQNEIGGPVTFAIVCFAIALLIIYFLA
jgi:hypothetical protein